jgi:hypothetical protein
LLEFPLQYIVVIVCSIWQSAELDISLILGCVGVVAGLQGIWGAWRNNTPNVTRNLHNWGNYSALPCNDDVYYRVSGLGWLGIGCEFQQNATSAVWNASVAML